MHLDHTNDIDWEQLDRYVTGTATAEEAAQVAQLLAEQPKLAVIVSAMRTADHHPQTTRRPVNVQAALQQLTTQLDSGVRTNRPARPLTLLAHGEKRQAWWRRTISRAAAAVILTCGALLGTRALIHRAPSQPTSGREIATVRGQRATMRLHDGTLVTLAAESRLRISPHFDSGSRDVYLEGEAYFTVTHDAARPFVVHTARGVAEDIGTAFVVTSYPTDTMVRVVVVEGRVGLGKNPNQRQVVLAKNDLGALTAGGQLLTKHNVAAEEYISWTTGRLTFRDARVRDVLAQLGRWYDLDFQLRDSTLFEKHITAIFRDDTPGQVIRLLAASLDARAEVQDRTVIFVPQRGHMPNTATIVAPSGPLPVQSPHE